MKPSRGSLARQRLVTSQPVWYPRCHLRRLRWGSYVKAEAVQGPSRLQRLLHTVLPVDALKQTYVCGGTVAAAL